MEKAVICKVWVNKSSMQKNITIPKRCDINKGDYVKVVKMKLMENGNVRKNKS